MAQELIIRTEDSRIMATVRKALSLMQGVTIVKPTKKKMSGYEEAMEDVRCGRVKSFDSTDALFKDLGI